MAASKSSWSQLFHFRWRLRNGFDSSLHGLLCSWLKALHLGVFKKALNVMFLAKASVHSVPEICSSSDFCACRYVAVTRARQRVWIFEEGREAGSSMLSLWDATKLVRVVSLGCVVRSLVFASDESTANLVSNDKPDSYQRHLGMLCNMKRTSQEKPSRSRAHSWHGGGLCRDFDAGGVCGAGPDALERLDTPIVLMLGGCPHE